MFTKIRPRLLISLVLATLLVIISVTNISAATSTLYGTVGGVNVRAEKTVTKYTTTWSAYLGSYANSTIGTIGYTYWTIQEKCVPTGQITYWKQYPGAVHYNSTQYYTGATMTYRSCSGQRQLGNLGNHDFKQGSGVWQPYLARYEYK